MKVVILAAGIGSRLGKIGRVTPKCLIEMGGKTILERQIEILNACGVKKENIIVVIGGKGEVWNEENKEKVKRIHANLIINEENIKKNQVYSLWLAIKEINDEIICIDGDSIFTKEVIEKIMKSKYPSIILTRKKEVYEKRLRVLVNNDRIIEIGIGVKSDRVYIPILKIAYDFLNALKKEIESGDYFDSNIAVPINNICKNFPIYNVDVEIKGLPLEILILNINTPVEYQKAKELFRKHY